MRSILPKSAVKICAVQFPILPLVSVDDCIYVLFCPVAFKLRYGLGTVFLIKPPAVSKINFHHKINKHLRWLQVEAVWRAYFYFSFGNAKFIISGIHALCQAKDYKVNNGIQSQRLEEA